MLRGHVKLPNSNQLHTGVGSEMDDTALMKACETSEREFRMTFRKLLAAFDSEKQVTKESGESLVTVSCSNCSIKVHVPTSSY
jgi:hypothetical protein